MTAVVKGFVAKIRDMAQTVRQVERNQIDML